MLHRLKVRIESYECWADEVKTALEPSSNSAAAATDGTSMIYYVMKHQLELIIFLL